VDTTKLTFKELQAGYEDIKATHEIQGWDGNWDYDNYMCGLFNGLELALAYLERRGPNYRSLKDTKEETKMELSEYQGNLYNKWVNTQSFQKMGEKMTVCLITLNNGFEIIGTSGCADPSKFDYEIGCHYALVDALNKLGQFDTFYEANKNVAIKED
jgi:hypothetical protein